MTENKDNLRAGTVEGLFFSAGSPGLSSLKNAMGWKKVG
jgi:hypothetical protein